jgi:hypothetical protein
MTNALNAFKYIDALRYNAYLVVFSVIVKAFQDFGVKWGSVEFSVLLDKQIDHQGWFEAWRKLTREAFDHVNAIYRQDVKRAKKKEDKVPTVVTYFKNQTYISSLMKKPLPASLKKAAKKAIEI